MGICNVSRIANSTDGSWYISGIQVYEDALSIPWVLPALTVYLIIKWCLTSNFLSTGLPLPCEPRAKLRCVCKAWSSPAERLSDSWQFWHKLQYHTLIKVMRAEGDSQSCITRLYCAHPFHFLKLADHLNATNRTRFQGSAS